MEVLIYVGDSDDLEKAAALLGELGPPRNDRTIELVNAGEDPERHPVADMPLTSIDGVDVVIGRLPSAEELEWLMDNAVTAQALARGEQVEIDDRFPTQSRIHINIDVHSVKDSLPFYEVWLGVKATKVRSDYAKFELLDPPVNLALNEVGPDGEAKINHLGLEVKSPDAVMSKRETYLKAGFNLVEELDVDCCYAKQNKVWAADPNGIRWETVNVVGDVAATEACPADCICYAEFTPSFVTGENS